MKKRLTYKQTKFAYEFIKNRGNAVQAALASYDTENYKSATKIADTNLKNPRIWEVIEKTLNKKGITVDKMVGIIGEGLNARIVQWSPETKEYKVLEFPDYNTRHKFLELTLDVLGARKNTTTIKEKPYTGVLSKEDIENIRNRVL